MPLSSPQYSVPITLNTTTTLKAKGWVRGQGVSLVKTAVYTITPVVADPTFSPAPGTYNTPQTVSISCSTSGAVIRYTTNGSVPIESSTQYVSPLSVNDDIVIKAKAFKTNWTPSNTVTAQYVISSIIYVSWTSTGGTYNGLSWTTAYHSIADAINTANDGDQIWVASGSYSERITTKSGVGLYGGFAGNETTLESRDYCANEVSISGGDAGVVVTVPQSASNTTIIDGFTIQHGSSTSGGGIRINQDAEAVVANCYIRDNSATSGAGIYVESAVPTIANNVLVYNSATNGAAIYLISSPAIITNNTIIDNAVTGNAAVYIDSGTSLVFANNIVHGNSNGIFNQNGTPTLRNNCVEGNTAYDYSGLSAGTNDIALDPLFIFIESNLYIAHLSAYSPCINAGNDAYAYETKDIDHQDRKNGSAVDIGADEAYQVATPVISPNGGAYLAPKIVGLTCSTSGVTIRYTIDGTEPHGLEYGTFPSPSYTGNLSLYNSCTLKVKAYKANFIPSEVASAVFTITDTTPPATGILDAPTYANSSPFTINYSGVHDIGDSGLKTVELWFKYGLFGTWTYTSMSRSTGSGSYSFAPAGGVGVYYFALVAEDNSGLRSAPASGQGQDSTIYIYNLDACSLPAVIIPPMP